MSATLYDLIPRSEHPANDDLLGQFLEYTNGKSLQLYPAQETAILELFEEKNVILNTPTGSGKSLVAAALHFNALLVLSIPAIGWVAVRYTVRRLKGEPQTFDFHPAWLWGLLILGLLFGFLRNLPFARAAWLAP